MILPVFMLFRPYSVYARILFLFLFSIGFFCCETATSPKKKGNETLDIIDSIITPKKLTRKELVVQLFNNNPIYIASGFDFPVGKPDARGYYNAQSFGKNAHLGDDWNAITGGDSDLGDPIYAIANGYVNFAEDYFSGWGKIIRIWHKTSDGRIVESFYAHCLEMLVKEGDFVKKGAKIATIGNADGAYLAHLHFEIRDDLELPVGPGYSNETKGYLDPTAFIKANRSWE